MKKNIQLSDLRYAKIAHNTLLNNKCKVTSIDELDIEFGSGKLSYRCKKCGQTVSTKDVDYCKELRKNK